MNREAYKLVVFPHGKQEVSSGKFAFKYLIAGVLLSQEEIEMPIETLIMDENYRSGLTDVLRDSRKFSVEDKLGGIGNAIRMLGCYDPEHHKVQEYLSYYIDNDSTASDDCYYIRCNSRPEFSECIGPDWDKAEARCQELNDSRSK